MYLKLFILLVLHISVGLCFGQSDKYAIPDSIATEVSKTKYKEVRDLTFALTKDLEDEEMIYRAIVKWISLNVEYKITDSEDGNEVIKRGVAKCAGYSLLVHEMCFHAGLQSRIVSGASRPGPSAVGKNLDFNSHAWNAVRINGEWFLSDVTWVTSSSDIVTGDYTYGFSEEYFLQTPEESIKMGHYPEDPNLMFLDEEYPARKFKKEPRCYKDYLMNGKEILDQEEVKGVVGRNLKIEIVKSDTVDYSEFRITYLSGKDWFATKPISMKEKGDKVVLKFNLKEVRSEPLFLKYKGQTYLGMRKR